MENSIEINEIQDFNSYIRSLDFTDPFILCLGAFHVSAFVLILVTRRFALTQVSIFFVLLAMVYSSESLNQLAAERWQSFSRQQYFDSSGMFISIVFSMPILVNCILIIGVWLYESSQTMGKLKAIQLSKRLNAAQENKKDT